MKARPKMAPDMHRTASRALSVAIPILLMLILLTARAAAADTVTATVNVGSQPEGLALDTANGDVYVANYASNTVSVISGATNAVVANVTVGTGPDRLAFDSANGDIYVANWGSGTVSVISGSTNAVIATVPVGAHLDGVAFDSANRDIYVAYTAASGMVSVISGSTNAVVGTMSIGEGAFHQAAFDPANGDVYVTNYGSGTVSVISGATNSVIANVTVGTQPNGVAFDSASKDVFVTNMVASGTISVISSSTNAVVNTSAVGVYPFGIAFDSDNGDLYVTNYGSATVSLVSGTTEAVVGTVGVGVNPIGIVFDSANGDVYVANYGSNSVSVIQPTSTSETSSSSSVATTSTATTNSSTPSLLQQVWVPPPGNALAAVGVSAVVVAAVSLAFSWVSNPLASVGGAAAQKTNGLIPDNIRQWLQEIVASRRKLDVQKKTGSPFIPTRAELLAYVTAVVVLAVSFSYVKVASLGQIWELLPVFFATSVIVAFAQEFFSIVFMRSRGVWSEHKIWPLGLVLFLASTFAFRVPFSSPTRTVNQSTELTNRISALSSAFEILIGLAFAGVFFLLVRVGYPGVGGAGLAMCVLATLTATLPVAPMSGKDIFDYGKPLWAGLFITAVVVFLGWLLLM